MPTTLPGGLWYPERYELDRVVTPTEVTVAVGDAIGNRFTLDFPVRVGGVGVQLELWDDLHVALLDPDDAVVAERDWAAQWTAQYGGGDRQRQVLCIEWSAVVDLAASVEYRLVVTATGSVALPVFTVPLDPPPPPHTETPGTGTLIRRISGVWSDDATARMQMALRITAL